MDNIKGLCIESGGNSARFLFRGELPVCGRKYSFEDISSGTNAQNSLFHSLLQCWWDYMFKTNTFKISDQDIIYDFSCDSWQSLKEMLKLKHGKGGRLKYVDNDYHMIDAKHWDDIPEYVIEDFNNGNHKRIQVIIYSWGEYSKPQRHQLITKVFYFMDLFGVTGKAYNSIKDGLIQIENERKEADRRKRQAKKELNQ